jgi:D-psicose/D-tagatose/L-ribulose 3-epimerase
MKIALCNEVLQPLPFEAQCRMAAALGYDGLEVAPFTLADDPDVDQRCAGRAPSAASAEDHGLAISGLHWLLVAPAGLSIVSADAAGLRQRTVAVMERLVELCALMGGRYLVHGSPKQRSVPAASHRCSRTRRGPSACLAAAARRAEACGVTYCLEPLSTRETDFVNTVARGGRDRRAGRFAGTASTMIDCSAAGQVETESVADLMARWMPTGHIAHVQVNDPNRRGPGQGAMAFAPILSRCSRCRLRGHYRGIVAVEPFDYVPDGPGSAARAIGYLRGVLEGLAAA